MESLTYSKGAGSAEKGKAAEGGEVRRKERSRELQAPGFMKHTRVILLACDWSGVPQDDGQPGTDKGRINCRFHH